jgi:NAD(P)-dependent dehydrogenase (short-subunit alcohol dehydrogenase family)
VSTEPERRAALVTGGSSGIGLSIAAMLAEEGHAVTLVARRPERLEAAAEELAATGAEVETVAAELSTGLDVVEYVVAAHEARFGRLDVLVNNAGVGVQGPIAEMSESQIDLQLGLNLKTAMLFYRAAMPLLAEAGRRHRQALVVNTASAAGREPDALLAAYAASKAGLIAFNRAMNKELGVGGIKSCVLCPGYVDTPLVEYAHEQVTPTEMIRPEDVGEMVRALLRLSPACVVPEIDFQRPGGAIW